MLGRFRTSESSLPLIFNANAEEFEGIIGWSIDTPLRARDTRISAARCLHAREDAYSGRFITRRASRRCRLGMSNDTFARMRGASRSAGYAAIRNRRAAARAVVRNGTSAIERTYLPSSRVLGRVLSADTDAGVVHSVVSSWYSPRLFRWNLSAHDSSRA